MKSSKNLIQVYRSGIHRGEEPFIFGNDHAGMINFSGCMLSCNFCYTPEASRESQGKSYSESEFFDLLIGLTQKGAKNLNLITPSHLWNQIEGPLMELKAFTYIPIVLKIGGNEPIRLLERMRQIADVFVPDFKIWDPVLALERGLPQHYGTQALRSIEFLNDCFESSVCPSHPPQSPMTQGILVRHLLMPGLEEDSLEIVKRLQEIRFPWILNLMTHFIDSGSNQIIPYPLESLNRIVEKCLDGSISILINGSNAELFYQKQFPLLRRNHQ